MAKSKKIDLSEWVKLHGSGFVIKVRNGKPYIAKKPKRDKARRKSDAEQKQVDLFKRAVAYAKDIIADPQRAAQYEKDAKAQDKPIYNVAVADYMRRSEELVRREKLTIREIQIAGTDKYHFLKIFLDHPEPFRRVSVDLTHIHGEKVEHGDAEQATVDSWWYILKNSDMKNFPFKLQVTAWRADGVVLEGLYIQA